MGPTVSRAGSQLAVPGLTRRSMTEGGSFFALLPTFTTTSSAPNRRVSTLIAAPPRAKLSIICPVTSAGKRSPPLRHAVIPAHDEHGLSPDVRDHLPCDPRQADRPPLHPPFPQILVKDP
nr:hypothetical protein [Planifilum fimeticola]